MVTFPRIARLSTDDYQLYPGGSEQNSLVLEFTQGPWVVLGVNGIGKSTLLLLIKHLLVGPYTARPAGFAGEKTPDLIWADKNLFAARVEDRARNALGTLDCIFGSAHISITRNLHDLTLSSVIGPEGEIRGEGEYQALLADLMGVERFEDVVAIAERIIFKLERRTDLLWNSAAQYEILKAVLLPEVSRDMRAIVR